MNLLAKILLRLFPRDGQLRIAVYDDGHAQIQQYQEYNGIWQPYRPINTIDNGYRYTTEYYYNSFDEAKQAYDTLMKERKRLKKMHSITRTYP